MLLAFFENLDAAAIVLGELSEVVIVSVNDAINNLPIFLLLFLVHLLHRSLNLLFCC